MSKISVETFLEGSTIIKEGDPVEHAYIINHGRVEVVKNLSKNETVSLAILGAGQIFGEMSLFGDKKGSASVKAISDVEVQIVDKKIFQNYLEQTPPLIKMLLEIMAHKLSKTSQKYMFACVSEVEGKKFVGEPEILKIDFDTGKLHK